MTVESRDKGLDISLPKPVYHLINGQRGIETCSNREGLVENTQLCKEYRINQ
jgi:hypothetical protein